MVALAIFNRYALVPQILDRPELAARSIRRGTIAEIAFALCVTALVSVLGMLEPA
jgi:putative copper export protein